MHWTEEQILALAPDTASVKAGKGQANIGKWPSLGATNEVLWGEVKGSGSKPYQTRIDLKQVGYKCSCPSRKFPCKHAIGLFLLHVRTPESFSSTAPPEWVTSWLEQRTKRAEKVSEKKAKPVNKEAQQKRAEKRIKKVAVGIDELQLWLKDLIRGGIASLPEKPSTFWKNTEARMVDAQAPGLATMVRSLQNMDYYSAGWEYKTWDIFTQLHLVTEGFKHRECLSAETQEDIKSIIGWTYSQEELKLQTGVEDIWSILGKQETQEDRLTVIKYWLKGDHSGRYALILQFVASGQPKSVEMVAGTSIEAELVFYPGNNPLRAVVKSQQKTIPSQEPSGYQNFSEFEQAYASIIAVNPWINQIPVIFSEITPSMVQGKFLALDEDSKSIPIVSSYDDQWKLLALSGGKPVQLCGVVENQQLYPLGVWALSEYHLF